MTSSSQTTDALAAFLAQHDITTNVSSEQTSYDSAVLREQVDKYLCKMVLRYISSDGYDLFHTSAGEFNFQEYLLNNRASVTPFVSEAYAMHVQDVTGQFGHIQQLRDEHHELSERMTELERRYAVTTDWNA